MATTPQPADQFSFWSTDVLMGIAFRVTPKHEHSMWVATSEQAWDYSESERRHFVVEQLECLGIDINDVNKMKS